MLPAAFAPVTVDGVPFYTIHQQFNRGTDEGLFGLGQHQNGQMNYNGEDVELAQHNMDVAIPFLVSTRNYGLLWDNPSITRFGNPHPYSLAGGPDDPLKVTGANGAPGWTATYTVNGKPLATRQEATIDYQYLETRGNWPAGARKPDMSGTVDGLKVVWTGRVVPGSGGLHKFRLFSSGYAKVFINGEKVLDRWRQNWNAFYHNFDAELAAGKPVDIRVEWEPDSGYIALDHDDPWPKPDRHSIQFTSEAGKAIDYYYVGGDSIDNVIAGYRQLTGKGRAGAEMGIRLLAEPPALRDAGPIARRAAQISQARPSARQHRPGLALLAAGCLGLPVLRSRPLPRSQRHGRRHPPQQRARDDFGLGEILQGSRQLRRVPAGPRHARAHGKPAAERAQGRRLTSRTCISTGSAPVTSTPSTTRTIQRARDIYWRQVRDGIAAKGFDAYWLDSDEPDFHSNLSIEERSRRMSPTAAGPGRALFNSYPLEHVEGVYRGLVGYKPDVRPFILTRSAFAGIQRDGAAVWSGDVASRWDNFREQISAGVNISMSGIPNWSTDIGGYTMEPRFLKPTPADLDEWRELNLRWFQFGAFSPLFRSHGENIHREIFEIAPAGSPMYRSMAWYDRCATG